MPTMTLWQVTATNEQSRVSRTFYLDGELQGLDTEEQAKNYARSITSVSFNRLSAMPIHYQVRPAITESVPLCESEDHDGAEVRAVVTVRCGDAVMNRCPFCAEGLTGMLMRRGQEFTVSPIHYIAEV